MQRLNLVGDKSMTLRDDIEQWQNKIVKLQEKIKQLNDFANRVSECPKKQLGSHFSKMLGFCSKAEVEIDLLIGQLEEIQIRWGIATLEKMTPERSHQLQSAISNYFINVCNDPEKSSESSDRPSNEAISGETPSTKLGKEIHAERAAQRRASGQYDLVNEAIPDKAGNPIFVPKEIDIKTGKPKPDTPLQKAVPDAVNFNQALIIDDKPLGRPIMKDRQEIIRFINAYKQREGVLPQTIEIHRYDENGQMAKIESYKPEDFLPKITLGGT